VPARGYELWPVPKVPLPRRPSLAFFRLPGKLSAAINSAKRAIQSIDAQVVIGFGGYVSTPAYLAAHQLGVPIVVHEGNARPGLANRLGARWASAIGLTFPGAKLAGAKVVGLPLRHEIQDLVAQREQDATAARQAAAAQLGLDPQLPTLLVSGGSSGAVSINLAAAKAAQALAANGIQVLHLTGKGKDKAVLAQAQGVPNYHVREYLAEMQLALASADLVLTRSGAGMVCELAALGLPAIYVPLPIGNGEQRLNVAPLIAAGGGIEIADDALTADWLSTEVPKLLGDKQRLANMSQAAAKIGVRDGAARIVDLIEGAIKPLQNSDRQAVTYKHTDDDAVTATIIASN